MWHLIDSRIKSGVKPEEFLIAVIDCHKIQESGYAVYKMMDLAKKMEVKVEDRVHNEYEYFCHYCIPRDAIISLHTKEEFETESGHCTDNFIDTVCGAELPYSLDRLDGRPKKVDNEDRL